MLWLVPNDDDTRVRDHKEVLSPHTNRAAQLLVCALAGQAAHEHHDYELFPVGLATHMREHQADLWLWAPAPSARPREACLHPPSRSLYLAADARRRGSLRRLPGNPQTALNDRLST